MKYVRTKDRVGQKAIPSEDCPIIEDEHWLLLENGSGLIHKDNEPIIKEADTIEELIDAILVKGKNEYDKELMVIYQGWLNLKGKEKIEQMKNYINDYLYWSEKGEPTKKELYGIIFAYGEHNEPILKSVAKLNDKGELELWKN